MESTTKAPKPRLFTLTVDDRDQASPNLKFIWCLKPEARRLLQEEHGARFPHMLVVVARKVPKQPRHADVGCDCDGCKADRAAATEGVPDWAWEHVERQLYPLHEGYGQVQFNRSGDYTVFAFIVFDKSWMRGQVGTDRRRAARLFRKAFLRKRDDGSYQGYVDLEVENPIDYHADIGYLSYVEVTDVHISASLFAERPRDWVWWWVNLFHENPPRDECQFRRRAMIAWTVQVPIMMVAMFGRAIWGMVLLLVFAGLGWRNIRIKPIFHWSTPIDLVKGKVESEECGYFPKTDANGKDRPWWQRILLTPWHWAAAICLVAIFLRLSHEHRRMVFAVGGGVVVLIVCLFIGFVVGAVIRAWYRHRAFQAQFKKPTAKPVVQLPQGPSREELEARRYYATYVGPLTCDLEGPKKVSVNALPPSHRTLHVRWMEAKAAFCKPFGA